MTMMTEPPGCHLLYMYRGGLVLSCRRSFCRSTVALLNTEAFDHREKSSRLATTYGCLLFQQHKSGAHQTQNFIIKISPISDWVWQRSSRKIKTRPKITKSQLFTPPPPIAIPILADGISELHDDRPPVPLPPPTQSKGHYGPFKSQSWPIEVCPFFPNNKSRWIRFHLEI